MVGTYPSGGAYFWQTTKASMDEFLDDLGLATVTSGKNIRSCE